jgi:AraC-like DNA-binding protein
VIDGNRITTAGGTASIDLMLKIIADDHGEDLANLVADQLIYTSIRTDQDTQRLSIPTRIGVRHPKLGQVIRMMEQNIEDPISPAQLAKDVSMSTRQLERLFRRYLNRSPKRYYMELRLAKARNLLMQTDMSVINVALACGFASPSHFSKCYRAHYDTTPYRERGSQATRVKTAEARSEQRDQHVGIAVEGHVDRHDLATGPLVPQHAGIDVAPSGPVGDQLLREAVLHLLPHHHGAFSKSSGRRCAPASRARSCPESDISSPPPNAVSRSAIWRLDIRSSSVARISS